MIEFTTGDIDTFGQYQTLGFTARDGRYYPGHANAIAAYTGLGGASGADPAGDYALSFKRTRVVDHETGLQMYMNAPANVRMVTPVTAMLVAPGSAADKLKTQLGIAGSLFGMTTNPDLATYDAIAEAASGDSARAADAARMHAANLRVLALMAGLYSLSSRTGYNIPGADLSLGDIRPGISPTEALGARCLAAAPALFLFQNDRMSGVIQCYVRDMQATQPNPNGIVVSTAKVNAIAHLIDGYAAAMPVRVETSADKARWALGINGYLRPMIGQILSDPTDAAAQAVLAITAISPTILTETARYADFYRYNDTGLYMPSPDFLVLPGTTTLTVAPSVLTGNDFLFSNAKVNTRGIDPAGGVIQSLTIPTANVGQIAVTQDSTGNITVTALGGFKGVSYFDYVARASNGEVLTTRVYVRMM